MNANNEWQGKLIRLRAIEPSDWQIHYAWNKDTQMTRNVDFVWFPTSQASVKQWAEQAAVKEHPEPDKIALIIETLDGQHVGMISTNDCNPRSGTFTYGIAIRRQHHRHGYASDAMQILLRHFFLERRYQKVNAHVLSFNTASIALHEKFGMQHEARLRRTIYTKGQYYDELIFGMTAEEFFAKYPLDDAY
jgi:RimJ/RimL family protein N-acetyltransferase